MTIDFYKNKIKKESNKENLKNITYEAFKDKDISMKQYDKIVAEAVKKELKGE